MFKIEWKVHVILQWYIISNSRNFVPKHIWINLGGWPRVTFFIILIKSMCILSLKCEKWNFIPWIVFLPVPLFYVSPVTRSFLWNFPQTSQYCRKLSDLISWNWLTSSIRIYINSDRLERSPYVSVTFQLHISSEKSVLFPLPLQQDWQHDLNLSQRTYQNVANV